MSSTVVNLQKSDDAHCKKQDAEKSLVQFRAETAKTKTVPSSVPLLGIFP